MLYIKYQYINYTTINLTKVLFLKNKLRLLIIIIQNYKKLTNI